MHKSFTKVSGISLCFRSLISAITMALHPADGSVEHIIRIQHVLIFSHSLGIACLPFMGFGALGLSCILQTDSNASLLSLFVFCLGLVAAMIAATVNGLILPQFLSDLTAKPLEESYNYMPLSVVVITSMFPWRIFSFLLPASPY